MRLLTELCFIRIIFPKPLIMTGKESDGTISWTPLAMVTSGVVDRREVPNTWPRPPDMVRTETTVAADGGSCVLQEEWRTQKKPIERSPSSSGRHGIALTEPPVQHMDRSWGSMTCALS